MTLEEKLSHLPDEPGVYLMQDARGHIIYIGKALSLRSRVRSYFQKGAKDDKTEALVRQISDLETIVTHGARGPDPRGHADQEAPSPLQHHPP
jgi:excinuclease ABC subunit C